MDALKNRSTIGAQLQQRPRIYTTFCNLRRQFLMPQPVAFLVNLVQTVQSGELTRPVASLVKAGEWHPDLRPIAVAANVIHNLPGPLDVRRNNVIDLLR